MSNGRLNLPGVRLAPPEPAHVYERRRPGDPADPGRILAHCTNCGATGLVNRKLAGASQRARHINIPACTNCRTTPDLKNMMRQAQEAKQGL